MKLQPYEIAAALEGTCDGVELIIDREELDMDADDVMEILAEHNIEECPECGWWVDAGELADCEGELQACDGCRQ